MISSPWRSQFIDKHLGLRICQQVRASFVHGTRDPPERCENWAGCLRQIEFSARTFFDVGNYEIKNLTERAGPEALVALRTSSECAAV
ncbi:hypothetical protein D7V77_14145 [Corallococcus sp. CA041A]|nr:hypothetical protein D7V77_14145 [Corallococcus sp. CA041A]